MRSRYYVITAYVVERREIMYETDWAIIALWYWIETRLNSELKYPSMTITC